MSAWLHTISLVLPAENRDEAGDEAEKLLNVLDAAGYVGFCIASEPADDDGERAAA